MTLLKVLPDITVVLKEVCQKKDKFWENTKLSSITQHFYDQVIVVGHKVMKEAPVLPEWVV